MVARPNVVRQMRRHASPEFLETVWKVGFPGQIPDRLVIAEELAGNVIDLEGQDLHAGELGDTDTNDTTCLHVPSIGLVVAAMPPTTTFMYTWPSRMCKRDGNGSQRSTP